MFPEFILRKLRRHDPIDFLRCVSTTYGQTFSAYLFPGINIPHLIHDFTETVLDQKGCLDEKQFHISLGTRLRQPARGS